MIVRGVMSIDHMEWEAILLSLSPDCRIKNDVFVRTSPDRCLEI